MCGHVDSNTRSRENIQLPMNGLPGAPVSEQMLSLTRPHWPNWQHLSTKYRIISLRWKTSPPHTEQPGLTVLWLLSLGVRNSRFFLPEWAVVNDVLSFSGSQEWREHYRLDLAGCGNMNARRLFCISIALTPLLTPHPSCLLTLLAPCLSLINLLL